MPLALASAIVVGALLAGMSTLMVDHNVRRVIAETDYIYVLSMGRIAGEGTHEDFEQHLHGQVKEWLGISL